MKISIVHKFTYLFIIIFLFSFILSTFYINKTIKNNNKEIIDREMMDLMLSSKEYVKQHFLINNITPSISSFEKYSQNIGNNLSEKSQCNTEIYSTYGKFLCISNLENEEILLEENINNENKDIVLAKNDTAATTTLRQNTNMYVKFSFPLYINNKFIGIIRLTKNYSSLYSSRIHMIKTITIFFAILFTIVLLSSILISRHITKPILTLRKSLMELSNGNYDSKINIKNNDEVGDLSKDFCTMRNKIKNQIKTIKKDKERIIISEKHKQDFFNNVTHELKTPLTNISGYAQILEEEAFSNDSMYIRATERIKSESERLHSMVIELIKISKNNTCMDTPFYKINVSPLIIKICDDMNLKSKKYNMKIKPHIEQPIYIYGNTIKIQELIINLLDNAIKYGKPNTSIDVMANKNTSFFNLEIKNLGRGISKYKLNKIFEAFYRINNTEKEKGSCGLGLFICKNIVKEHNGEIFAESIENKFTKIIVKIPLFSNTLATNKDNIDTSIC